MVWSENQIYWVKIENKYPYSFKIMVLLKFCNITGLLLVELIPMLEKWNNFHLKGLNLPIFYPVGMSFSFSCDHCCQTK